MVKAWREKVTIPTYGIGKEEKNPVFLEKRVYQGSCGSVYPYPVIEKIEDKAEDKVYDAIYLENEYILVMILPQLGGRVQMAYDKIKKRHFIYYNSVVKPALVGLTGPWISGGIEINWPQHHRPSTFMPLDSTIEDLPDGGVTVWVSERERMFHQKGMAGYTLRPGIARLEIRGQIYNPTPIPQTFLWWANPAVKVNDAYQSVFPPDVNAVFDHGKRAVSTFPIATGVYYKVDYSAGVDISRYKNIPVPTSYMAVKSKYDFIGGYEHDTHSGMIHVADHHVSTGKKQWTWGCGDFGKAWDRNLTDSDGPYIELMTGVYCDNQPDFSWMQPYEEKTFTQYFMPYRELGVVKNANKDIFMNIEKEDGRALLKIFATRKMTIRALVRANGQTALDVTSEISPEDVRIFEVPGIEDVMDAKVAIFESGKMILSWEREPEKNKPVPDPAKPALDPKDIKTTEQLFLTGQHLEQYRHATYNPVDYYSEALRRDPSDIRNNNALGLLLFRKGKFQEAEKYLRRAVETQTERNPNPYDGEPLFNLGICLKYQGKLDEAYDVIYKSCWNGAQQAAGYFELARISALRGDYQGALYELDMSLSRGWHNVLARALKTTCLRKLGRKDEASAFAKESLALDPFNTGCLFEMSLLPGGGKAEFLSLMRSESHNYEELAKDYILAGQWEEAREVLSLAPSPSPMNLYYAAYSYAMENDFKSAGRYIAMADAMDPECCFPNALEAILALQKAIELCPGLPKAYYYLGNLWYDKRQHSDAIECWEKSNELDGSFPTVKRNLSLAYFNKLGRKEEAVKMLEAAFALDESDARILMELDQLYKRMNYQYSFRLGFLRKHLDLVMQRDDLYLELVTILNMSGEYSEAKSLIDKRKFHPWEGGEGKVPAQYQYCRIELAKEAISSGDYDKGIELLDECRVYPENLGEGKLAVAQENDIDYLTGIAMSRKGRKEEADRLFEKASQGPTEPVDAVFYNDQKPDKIFYQGLALLKLSRPDEARIRFHKLIDFAQKNRGKKVRIDYFAVSLPDLQIWEADLDAKNNVHCDYIEGLGNFGLGNKDLAVEFLRRAYYSDINHQGVKQHLDFFTKEKNGMML